MASRFQRNILSLLAVALVTDGLCAQGLYYESVLKGGPFQDKEQVSRTYLMPKMMKHVNVADGNFVILRLDKEKIISVDTKNKTYWEKTFSELEKSAKVATEEMEKRLSEMKGQMKNMPEAQRKMMEQMLGGKAGSASGAVQMSKTGETRKISGFQCTKYVAKEGSEVLMTIWTTREVKGFEPLRKDYEELSKRMTAMNPRFMKSLVDALSKVEGFPIQTDWGKISTTVTKVEQRSTPESEFAVPAGYTMEKAPMDQMQGQPRPE